MIIDDVRVMDPHRAFSPSGVLPGGWANVMRKAAELAMSGVSLGR
jgi:hypothetical protein